MARSMTAWLIALALIFTLPRAGWAQASKTFKHQTLGYSLTYPKDFALKRLGLSVTLAAPVKDPRFDFSPNVNIVSTALGQPVPALADFFKAAKKQISDAYAGIQVIEEKREKIAGVEAYKIIYTAQDKNALFKFLQYVLIHKNKAFVITYTALQDQFAAHLAQAQAIIRSFALGK